ncbi:polyketide synthase dehydratase domain-containing protein, partial [Streptomyces sp. NPDC020996]|uniref:polyketide synthase dehydratase domain-containing protein n=1 Tax=Streptomyces sp. NPDC020996 TaxID=3154791 RepID=UPI0033FC1599
EPEAFVTALAEAWTRGLPVTWDGLFGAARHVDLPTYPFQHRRYWLEPARPAVDAAGLGLATAGHPLLGAAVHLADDRLVLTGRLAADGHPWLADHAVAGTVLLPGTAFVELVLRAGEEAGCAVVEELTLEAPLALPERGAVQIQVEVGAPQESGARSVAVHARAEGTADVPWTRHASGSLAPGGPAPAAEDAAWPPPGAQPVDLAGFYEGLAAAGYTYGPAFRGLRAAWRLGDEILAEVVADDDHRAEAGEFGLHPALLDAALHGMLLDVPGGEDAALRLPFSWSGVRLYAEGATALRVRLQPVGGDTVRVNVADTAGLPVAAIEALSLLPVSAEQLERARAADNDSLFRVAWTPLTADHEPPRSWAVLGTPHSDDEAAATVYADLGALAAAVADGTPVPDNVLLPVPPRSSVVTAERVREETARLLTQVQRWLDEPAFDGARLVIVTHGAIAVRRGEDVSDLVHAGVWGLVRSAQAENPGRLVLVDVDTDAGAVDEDTPVIPAVATGEEQIAVRDGELLAPRLTRRTGSALLTLPDDVPWRLDTPGDGTLESLAPVPFPEAAAPLTGGQVRIAVRAAGLNFRDVLMALGMYPDTIVLGSEAAGVVTEVGPGVTDLAVGDRVMGMVPHSFAAVTVADARMVVRVPRGWSFEQAASVPAVFLTAYYALVDLAGLRRGERVLVHSAAGGVGMAAVQLARRLGAEVFGTASEGKWDVLRREARLEAAHYGSSRSTSFEERFKAATGGRGMDVILDCLAGELVDASLRLLPRGGRFVEMGKTDIRDPEQVARDHPGVAYRAFDLMEAGPERIGEMLRELVGLFEAGVLRPLPVRAWDVRR